MNKKIRRLLREVERRGGLVFMHDSTPDDVAEKFLNDVLRCPGCCARKQGTAVATRADDRAIYGVIAGGQSSKKPSGQ